MVFVNRLLLASLSLALAVLAAQAEESKFDTPEKAATTYLTALTKGDGKALLAALLKDEREKFKDKIPEKFDVLGTQTFKLGEVRTDGNTSVIQATISAEVAGSTETFPEIVVCIKADESWWVSREKSIAATGFAEASASPHGIANAFMEAYVKHDSQAALACLVKAEREKFKDKFTLPDQDDKLSFVLGSAGEKGDRAEVETLVKRTTAGGKTTEAAQVLVCLREDGVWRISMEETKKRSKEAGTDAMQRVKESEARACLGAFKDRCRVVYARNNKAPSKFEEIRVSRDEAAMDAWTLKEEFRVALDGKQMCIEAISKDSDDMLMVRFNLDDGKGFFLGCQRKIDNEVSQKDAQTLLTTMRDYLRVQYQKLGAMPKNITGDGKTITSYDLVGEYWIAHNEFTSKDNTVTLTADSINEAKVATLEFDITKGGGEVKFAAAYDGVAIWIKAQTEVGEIAKALNVYKVDNGDYPAKLEAVKGNFNDKIPVNPFTKTNYDYEVTETGFKLSCRGRDNKPGGRWRVDKDIVWTERGQAE